MNGQWWPAFAASQPSLRNSCELRVGKLANRDADVVKGTLAVGEEIGEGQPRTRDAHVLEVCGALALIQSADDSLRLPVTHSGRACEKGWEVRAWLGSSHCEVVGGEMTTTGRWVVRIAKRGGRPEGHGKGIPSFPNRRIV